MDNIKTMYADVKINQLCYGMIIETVNSDKFLVIGSISKGLFEDSDGNSFDSCIQTRDTIEVNNDTITDYHTFNYKDLRLLSLSNKNIGYSISLFNNYNEDLTHKENHELDVKKIFSFNTEFLLSNKGNVNLLDNNCYEYICDIARENNYKKESPVTRYVNNLKKEIKELLK